MYGFDIKNNKELRKNRNAARSKLQRKGLSNCSKLIDYLFNVFLNCEGKILAAHLYERDLCTPGNFSLWRNHMKELGIIYWHQISEKKWAYFAGPAIVDYINKEKQLTKELATTEDIFRIEKSIDRIINIIDPISNAQKRQNLLDGYYDKQLKSIT